MDRFLDDSCLIYKESLYFSDLCYHISDSETLCSPFSFVDFSQNYEKEMDSQLERFASDIVQEPDKIQKKRGRKPLRPNDPIQKKTEIKDKYWLRAFRNFIKAHLNKVKIFFDDESLKFWNNYVSKAGKPGKDSTFLSYGKSYKAFLFNEKTFSSVFKAWFLEFGEAELLKKYKDDSDLWFIYYDYALKEIAGDGFDFLRFKQVFQKKEASERGRKKVPV